MTQSSRRLASIDVFRALTMFLMIFVNDLVLDKDIPAWLEHAGESENRLGLADTVFPAFLFIVGLAIPFAIGGRKKKGVSQESTLLHILRRSFSLLVMGFFQVNYEEYNGVGAILPKYWWLLLVTIGFFLIWLDYPAGLSNKKKRILQGAGVLLLAVMAFVYQGGTPADPEWMKPHWYGILGLIGWAYLLCALAYLFAGDRLRLLWGILIFFIGFCIAERAGWLAFLAPVRQYIWISGSGGLPALTMAGVVVAVYYRREAGEGRTLPALAMITAWAVVALVVGLTLRPMGGISKIHSTPSWILICMGISLAAYAFVALLVDMNGKERWFRLLRPAGTSTLTCYLLTYLHFAIFQLVGFRLPEEWRTEIAGVGKSLIFSLLIVLLTGWLEKRRIRLAI